MTKRGVFSQLSNEALLLGVFEDLNGLGPIF